LEYFTEKNCPECNGNRKNSKFRGIYLAYFGNVSERAAITSSRFYTVTGHKLVILLRPNPFWKAGNGDSRKVNYGGGQYSYAREAATKDVKLSFLPPILYESVRRKKNLQSDCV